MHGWTETLFAVTFSCRPTADSRGDMVPAVEAGGICGNLGNENCHHTLGVGVLSLRDASTPAVAA